MKLSLLQYYLLCLFLLTVTVLVKDFEIGCRYVAFFLINLVALHFLRATHKLIALVFLGTTFLCYFLRGYVVAFNYNMFTFHHVYAITRPKVLDSFDMALYGTMAFLLGFILFSFRFSARKRIPLNTSISRETINSFWSITFLLVTVIVAKILLVQYAGVGRRGIANESSLGFLLRFIPLDLPFVILGLLLYKYRRELRGAKRLVVFGMLFGLSYSVFITGSKTFVMFIALCFVMYLLFSEARLKVSHFVFMLLIGFSITAFSFAVSKAVRIAFYTTEMTEKEVFDLGLKMLKDQDLELIFDEVTGRFNGFDGQLKYLSLNEPKYRSNLERLQNIFSLKQVGLHVAEALLPKVELTDEYSCGKGVGIFAERANPNKAYAGALGIMAAAELISPHSPFLFLFCFGILLSLCIKLINYVRNPDIQFVMFFFMSFFGMGVVMSGNFDFILSDMIIKLVVFAGALILLRVIQVVLSRTRNLQFKSPLVRA